jgi:predicted nucleic acid-binding protein
VADGSDTGILDTGVYVDLDLLELSQLPEYPELTSVTLVELHQGIAMAKDAATRATRTEKLGAAVSTFDPLPFDGDAAARYGTLVALVVAAGRDPRPRRMDLMIAAIASTRGLPLYTRNAKDFKGLEGVLTVVAI